jgi:hypothetical protein
MIIYYYIAIELFAYSNSNTIIFQIFFQSKLCLPTNSLIKAAIEILIDKGYLERNPNAVVDLEFLFFYRGLSCSVYSILKENPFLVLKINVL